MDKPSLNIWEAAELGKIEVLKEWVKYIKENNLGDDYINRKAIGTGNTPLIYAIQNKQIDAVYYLATIGKACTITPSSDNRTPLQNACFYGLIPVVILFLENFQEVEENINSQDKLGNTALHEAVLKENKPIIAYLLMHGADKTIKNKRNQTPKDLVKQDVEIKDMLDD